MFTLNGVSDLNTQNTLTDKEKAEQALKSFDDAKLIWSLKHHLSDHINDIAIEDDTGSIGALTGSAQSLMGSLASAIAAAGGLLSGLLGDAQADLQEALNKAVHNIKENREEKMTEQKDQQEQMAAQSTMQQPQQPMFYGHPAQGTFGVEARLSPGLEEWGLEGFDLSAEWV